jgi:hypothetical protein
MNTIRLAYSAHINAGDRLNVELMEIFSGKKVVRSRLYNAEMIAIGGALSGLQYSKSYQRKVFQSAFHLIYDPRPLYVWGSGFLYGDNPNILYRSNLKVCALRGLKTLNLLSSLTGISYDVPLADPGLLVDYILPEKENKKYELGVIPHFSQQTEPNFLKVKENPSFHFIDIRKPPAEVIKEISACEYIASSSLHGLIFADSLHIPSLHLLGKTPLPGGNFKYEDYYSSFGIQDSPWMVTKALPTANDIIDRYRIESDVIDNKKKALLKCFPMF